MNESEIVAVGYPVTEKYVLLLVLKIMLPNSLSSAGLDELTDYKR